MLPGEKDIKVEELLEADNNGRFRSKSGMWFTFAFLLGEPFRLSPDLDTYSKTLLQSIDKKIIHKGCLLSP